ncbi:hypothetical protein IE077_001730 [Cardiosporidium cionae]|uniref:Ribosomal RNA-processing protein 14/surfeit locus protein 6 C-terminal domain-containing protein n=1 Tax=Cardiosporidium cionae TaxID=476202 RepID=A0ABQ7JCL2_9APIC|nr:hypothetical protein IE077_001730 [Cardiosporidium cionae]|eukprot:KAF8821688.1 hypothetical protein IE077_001730 [Cardiosporidium cionae]
MEPELPNIISFGNNRMHRLIHSYVDSFVNLIPYQHYGNLTTEEESFSSDEQSRSDQPQRLPPITDSTTSHVQSKRKLHKLKRYAPLEWVSTVQRYQAEIQLNSPKQVSASSAVVVNGKSGDALVNEADARNDSNSTFLQKNTLLNKGNALGLSREQLKEKLIAKIESIRMQKSTKEKGKRGNKWLTKSKNKRIKKDHEEPAANTAFKKENSKISEQMNDRDIEFGSFLFHKATRETCSKITEQNKKGSKLRRVQTSIRNLEREANELSKLDTGKREQRAHTLALDRAMKRAQRQKIPGSLKSLRRAEKAIKSKKGKSKRKWENRTNSNKQKMQKKTEDSNVDA